MPNLTMSVNVQSREQILRHTTLEDYIEANGGVLSFLECLAEFAKANGLDWTRECRSMMDDAEQRARWFGRMRL